MDCIYKVLHNMHLTHGDSSQLLYLTGDRLTCGQDELTLQSVNQVSGQSRYSIALITSYAFGICSR